MKLLKFNLPVLKINNLSKQKHFQNSPQNLAFILDPQATVSLLTGVLHLESILMTQFSFR
jgi:hypothetical protein